MFLLVYAVDNRKSFEEVRRLHDDVIRTKSATNKKDCLSVPMVIVGNKCDLDKHRDVKKREAEKWASAQQSIAFLEASAKNNSGVNDVFYELFRMAKLPTEMSPSLHRKMSPLAATRQPPLQRRCAFTLQRYLPESYGMLATNARRPSLRSDLLLVKNLQRKETPGGGRRRESKCCIQ